MEKIQEPLESLLHQYFHFIPNRSRGRDQWYKRKYTAWKRQNPDRDILILTPKQSKDEWVVGLFQIANDFVTLLRDDTFRDQVLQETAQENFSPSDRKVFADWVLDDEASLLQQNAASTSKYMWRLSSTVKQFLTPTMQRLSFWTVPAKGVSFETRGRAVRELLERGQINSLIYLVHQPDTKIKEAATYSCNADWGWRTLIREMTQLLVFLVILKCFPESACDQGKGYWLPLFLEGPESLEWRYIRGPHGETALTDEKQLYEDVERCMKVLCMTDILWMECGFEPLRWEQQFIDTFLSYLGSRLWNRGSFLPHHGYKTVQDLLTSVSKDVRQEVHQSSDREMDSRAKKSTKLKDPLSLRGPKENYRLESDSDDDDEDMDEDDRKMKQRLDQLESLQSQEIAYGLKRSTKYQR